MFEKNRKKLREILDRLGDSVSDLEDILESEDALRDSLAVDDGKEDEYDSAERTCDSLDEAIDGVNEAIELIEEIIDN